MSERPPLALKKDADQVANLIASYQSLNDNERLILGKKLEAFEEYFSKTESDISSNIHSTLNIDERVGIWKASIQDGKKSFSRDPKLQAFFPPWANVQNIPPKSEKFRIILQGESVARGFLYDPYFNPAICLSKILNTELNMNSVEVIDLAKSDIMIDELKKTCESSLFLQPDAVVIFAGNNWLSSRSFSEGDEDQILKILQSENRFTTLKHFFEEKLKCYVIDFVEHIVTVFKEKNIPIVMIIPEFNLIDWKSLQVQRILVNPLGETSKWFEVKREIEKMFVEGDIKDVEPLINEMISLNEANPSGYELMAQYKLKNNQISEARHYLELAIDTSIFNTVNVPCIVSIIRNTLREELYRHQISFVDLPMEFDRFLSGGIPGKELFLDYCHLTEEGIQLSMALTAQKLILLIMNKDISLEKLKNMSQPLSGEVKAAAHFFAAIHNAHKGQPYENLFYHCLKALNLSSSITDLFIHYTDMVTRDVSWSISKSCEAIVGSGQISQYPMLLQPTAQPILDFELVRAMVNALKAKGIDIENKINTLRINEHGVHKGKINLLKSYYHNTSYLSTPIVSKGFFKSYEPESTFFLIAPESVDVAIKLTCRTPNIDADDVEISIMINGTEAPDLNLKICKTWKTFSLIIPHTLIKPGINKIMIKWPFNLDFKKNHQNRSIQQDKSKLLQEMLFPVYGEIHKFSASMSKEIG